LPGRNPAFYEGDQHPHSRGGSPHMRSESNIAGGAHRADRGGCGHSSTAAVRSGSSSAAGLRRARARGRAAQPPSRSRAIHRSVAQGRSRAAALCAARRPPRTKRTGTTSRCQDDTQLTPSLATQKTHRSSPPTAVAGHRPAGSRRVEPSARCSAVRMASSPVGATCRH